MIRVMNYIFRAPKTRETLSQALSIYQLMLSTNELKANRRITDPFVGNKGTIRLSV